MSAWLWLLLAGVFEIGMTTGLKLEQHDPQYLWLFLGCAIVSFECLAKAIRTIPLGLAYAIWTGIGAVGTVLIGAFAFSDPLGPVRVLLLTGLVAAMIGLKLVGGREPAKSGASPEQ